MVYILHFSAPMHHAKHYVGSTADVERRLALHRAGQGARLTQVAVERGIQLLLATVLLGSRHEERALKRRHNAPRYCPLCK